MALSTAGKDADLVRVWKLLSKHAQFVLGTKHLVELPLLAKFVMEKPLGALILNTVTSEGMND